MFLAGVNMAVHYHPNRSFLGKDMMKTGAGSILTD